MGQAPLRLAGGPFHEVNKRFVLEFKDATGDITPYYLRMLDDLKADGVEMGAGGPIPIPRNPNSESNPNDECPTA
ncbi:MAG: hypothetical protein JWO87_1863 [Phycisphaerales bacterium]|nr:hypothetical protein [Phycisphaerales bacterium]